MVKIASIVDEMVLNPELWNQFQLKCPKFGLGGYLMRQVRPKWRDMLEIRLLHEFLTSQIACQLISSRISAEDVKILVGVLLHYDSNGKATFTDMAATMYPNSDVAEREIALTVWNYLSHSFAEWPDYFVSALRLDEDVPDRNVVARVRTCCLGYFDMMEEIFRRLGIKYS